MRPSLPNSFFRLHIDKLGFDAEPGTTRRIKDGGCRRITG